MRAFFWRLELAVYRPMGGGVAVTVATAAKRWTWRSRYAPKAAGTEAAEPPHKEKRPS